jgi:ferredoxin-NADP reductase
MIMQLGDEVLVRKVAKGRFTLDSAHPERTNHLMVSTVTGIAPFVSYTCEPCSRTGKKASLRATTNYFC